MTDKDFIKYWIDSASDDWKIAGDLFRLKRFTYCLFFCQLSIEKLLKGLVYKNTKSHAQPIHKLVILAENAKLPLTSEMRSNLKEMSNWNIEARYDSYKRDFYKKATRVFTTEWFSKAEEIFLWLKNQY